MKKAYITNKAYDEIRIGDSVTLHSHAAAARLRAGKAFFIRNDNGRYDICNLLPERNSSK